MFLPTRLILPRTMLVRTPSTVTLNWAVTARATSCLLAFLSTMNEYWRSFSRALSSFSVISGPLMTNARFMASGLLRFRRLLRAEAALEEFGGGRGEDEALAAENGLEVEALGREHVEGLE